MRIISFATAESDWKSPRMGIILHLNGRDSGERLDCQKLFESAEHPANPLEWFDMDGRWFETARPFGSNATRARSTMRAGRGGSCRAAMRIGSRLSRDPARSFASD